VRSSRVDVLGAQGRVAQNLGLEDRAVPPEAARWVDRHHRIAVDPIGITPGINLCEAGAVAAAFQVDAVIAQCSACRLHVVDDLQDRVTIEIDSLGGQSFGTGGVSRTLGRHAFPAHQRQAGAHGLGHLWTAEMDRSVHPAITDQNDVVVFMEPLHPAVVHV